MKLAPDQFSSLKRVLSAPAAKVAGALGVKTAAVEAVLIPLEAMVRHCATALGEERLVVVYNSSREQGKTWTRALVAQLVRAKTPIVSVSDNGAFLGATQGHACITTAATESEKGPFLTVLCSAGHLCIFFDGKPIGEIGAPPPPTAGRIDLNRSWKELSRSFGDHFVHCVENEKSFRYWQDRKKRILLAGPDGTEKLFHQSLFWWLNHYIADALSVFGEAYGMGQDKTDINVVTEVGSILIEVKWLGENENGTKYPQARIHEGMLQVADYLDRDGRLVNGYLLAYDARPEALHINSSSYPPDCQHYKCEEPIIYFLRSETPSERASRKVATTKRENKRLSKRN